MYSRSQHVKCWQVSELNNYLKELLASNPFLSNLWVKGEISNLRQPSSGHLYFTLKDQTGSVRSVMFKSRVVKLPIPLRDGMEVLLRASLSIYERDGVYQLYVKEALPLGAGDLHRAFEHLKQQLEAEGLFRKERKKSLPKLPGRIGLVTSLTGAAIRDMVTILFERFPHVEIFVAPAQVQGIGASESIVDALELLNRHGQVDVIIAGRGGGSLEELWAFNTETVARAIAKSDIPVVTAVGHETDYTIADLVADLRAPTPSAAASLVVPDYYEEKARLENFFRRACLRMVHLIEPKRQKLASLMEYSILARPEHLFFQQCQHLEFADRKIKHLIEQSLDAYHTQLTLRMKKLDSLSPLHVLGRGFALCQNHEKETITSISQVAEGDILEVWLQDGSLKCQVQEVRKEDGGKGTEMEL